MQITFLHTASVHEATFDALAHAAAPHAVLRHLVAPDLLADARRSGADAVRSRTRSLILAAILEGADAVVCTCSTLGPVVPPHSRVVRIDIPLMEAAVALGPRVGIALCLDSTRAATLGLLVTCAAAADCSVRPQIIDCAAAWPLFEAGDTESFAAAVARQVQKTTTDRTFDCIVLAQASMAGAAAFLRDAGVPVLCAPALAVARAVEVASRAPAS